MDYTKLVDFAKQAAKGAYAPYSHYKVGAALLTADNKIYLGCNIENASYTPTVCGERVAFFKAVSDGVRDFKAIAIVGGLEGEIEGTFPPCGVCLQVMQEFCDPDSFMVILGTKDGYEEHTLREMFPFGFEKSKMNM